MKCPDGLERIRWVHRPVPSRKVSEPRHNAGAARRHLGPVQPTRDVADHVSGLRPGLTVTQGRIVTAYEELQVTGAVGGETLTLLRRLSGQYTRTHSFPPPQDYDRWSDEAIDYFLATLFSDKGPSFVFACLVSASDDASLERQLLTTIANHLKDQAKKTDRGKLRRRLDGLMNNDPRFSRIPASQAGIAGWTLTGGLTTGTTSDPTDLARAAWSVRGVSITRWNTAGPTPAGTRHALLTVAEAILAAAKGSLGDEDLARVIQSRFALLEPPKFTELKADENGNEPGPRHDDEPHVLDTTADRAAEVWEDLNPTERSLLPCLGEPDAALSAITGTGPKQTRAIADALAEKLRLATTDDPQRDEVVLALLQLCLPTHDPPA